MQNKPIKTKALGQKAWLSWSHEQNAVPEDQVSYHRTVYKKGQSSLQNV